MDELGEIEQRLKGVADPVAFVASVFAFAPVGLQVYTADGHSLLTNRAFRAMFGSEPPPEYSVLRDEIAARTGVLNLIQRAFAGETITMPPVWYDPRELEQVRITEGRRVWMEATFIPLRDGGGAVRHVALVFKDLTNEKVAAERAEALLKVAGSLSEAASTREVAEVILAGAMAAVGAPQGVLAVLSETGQKLRIVHSRGYARELIEEFSEMRLSDDLPLCEAIRTGQPVWVRSSRDLVERYPRTAHISPMPEGVRVMLPLAIEGRPLGAIGLTLAEARDPDATELAWLHALARLCSHAYERARLSDARARDAEREAERARFVAAASSAFSESLDLQATLRRVADVCVPRLGDYCLVDIAQRDGTYERIASACEDRERAAVLEEIRARYAVAEGSAQAGMRAIRSKAAVVLNEMDDSSVARVAVDDAHAALIKRLGTSSALAVPLLARGEPVGALTLGFFTQGRRYSNEEVALAQDLAQRAALAVEAARLYGEAQRAVRLREDFLSIAGHELKTPLTALHLQIQTVRRRLDKGEGAHDGARMRHSIEVAERQVKRLTALIHQLLDVSRLAAGRLSLELEPVDLSELAREVAARFGDEGPSSAGAGLTVDAAMPVIGRWDRLRLDQVLTNLLSNALRYGQGRPVTVAVEQRGDKALLRVRDQGIGIAAEDQERIFERFERAVPVRNYGGVGLGLWIVHELVAAMGGRVSVQSELGQGATFTVELPIGA